MSIISDSLPFTDTWTHEVDGNLEVDVCLGVGRGGGEGVAVGVDADEDI